METIIAAFTALILGVPLTAGAILSDKQEQLCRLIGGTYRPAPHGVNVCPGGDWGEFWKNLKPGRT